MQDNDTKHTRRAAKAFDMEDGNQLVANACKQCQFKPHEVKEFGESSSILYIARTAKPLSKRELIQGICLLRHERMPPAKCIIEGGCG